MARLRCSASFSPIPTWPSVRCAASTNASLARRPRPFRAWTRGETGYPVVDAGMRQLWRTGFLPNRVRMIAASFLAKHLLIDWRRGEQWFWDTLCDADPANNPQNWQWVAGCGVDAHPISASSTRCCRAISSIPTAPMSAAGSPSSSDCPRRTSMRPGALRRRRWRAPGSFWEDLSKPIVDHGPARARALAAFAQIKGEG